MHKFAYIPTMCSHPHFRVELEAEIRVQVDELMREELKNLKLVLSKN